MKKLFLIPLVMLIGMLLWACTPRGYDSRSLVPDECSYLSNIDDWQPVWCDEFDEDGLPDPSRWGYDVGGGGWGNRELQYYTNADLNNVFIEDGILNIRAVKEDHSGYDYTSARLVTKYRGEWEYGRVQVMAKMPSGRGLWPAIWMLPTNRQVSNWPHIGEIDIMEYVGYDPGVVHGTIHTGAFNHQIGTQIGYSVNIPTVEEQFHLYEMIWEPGKIELFVDGERFAQFGFNPDMNINNEVSDAWPFDDVFHLILNVAVGGDWGGVRGIDDSVFPQSMQIKYVRVYQKDYAGLTKNPPEQVNGLVLQQATHESARFKWDHAEHDVMVSHYNVYVNDILVGDTTVNAFRVDNLDPSTEYVVEVEAVDFKGQTAPRRAMLIETESVRTINERIEADEYDRMQSVRRAITDDGDGYHLEFLSEGSRAEYFIEIPESGSYRIVYRVKTPNGGTLSLFGRSPRFPLAQNFFETQDEWYNVTSEPFQLAAGVHTLRIQADQGGLLLNYFEVIREED